jgi:hypothetical protein
MSFLRIASVYSWMADLEEILMDIASKTWDRAMELVYAPLDHQNMLWTAIPLFIATLFMTLYFGRYKKEELGWNTAFGNTMVFLFVAISIIREMYNQGGGTFDSLFASELYTILSISLMVGGFLLMFFTYFHLLPKKLAFFLFSAPPINVTVYVVMTIVYADVIPDYLTALAGIVLLILILILAKIIQIFIRLIGLEERIEEIGIPGGLVEFVEEDPKKKPWKKK